MRGPWSRRQFLLLSLGAVAAAQASPLSVQGNAIQGFALFVSVPGPATLGKVEVAWEGRRHPMAFSPAGGNWRTVLPVSIDCPTRALLEVHSEAGVLVQRNLSVKPRNYGMQYITLSADTLASYDRPQNRADDEAILQSMAEFDAEQHWSGDFRLPCQAPQTSPFGTRRLYNGWKKSWHKGLDLGGWEGQPVAAPAAGTVVHRAYGVVNGNTLVVGHGLGVFSVYMHLLDCAVQQGEAVKAGQVLGQVGGSGGFSPHLHWETRVFGVPVHPQAFLRLPSDWRR